MLITVPRVSRSCELFPGEFDLHLLHLGAYALPVPGLGTRTGVPRSYKKKPPSDPTVAPCLGTYDDPRGVGVSFERSTPVPGLLSAGRVIYGRDQRSYFTECDHELVLESQLPHKIVNLRL